MTSSPTVCSPNCILEASPSCSPEMSVGSDYFNMRPSVNNSARIAAVSTPHDHQATLSLSGLVHLERLVEAPHDFFIRKVTRVNSSPLMHRRLNGSASSLASDSTVNDLFFPRSRRDDLITSSSTLVDDSPKAGLLLPKLSIQENHETQFIPSVPSTHFPSFGTGTVRQQTITSSPTLTKHLSSPTLKSFDTRKPTTDYLSLTLGLSRNVKLLSNDELKELFQNVRTIEPLNLPNLMVIDVRSFTEYIKSHIANSINICLPSTLLKRLTFLFRRCINSLPLYERLVMKTYFNWTAENIKNNQTISSLGNIECSQHGFPAILVYDTMPNSFSTYYLVKKIVDDLAWDSPIYVSNDYFGELGNSVPAETGSKQHFDINNLINNDTNAYSDILTTESLSSTPSPLHKIRSQSLNMVPTFKLVSPVETSTPVLSNFKLPELTGTPCFKIRHNEEVMGTNDKLGIDLIAKYNQVLDKLPGWLNIDTIREDALINKFNHLELMEKKRLNDALTMKNNNQILGSGIEKGHKNRYKDIFLYEYSRVKLMDFEETCTSKICDYINASYIDSATAIVPAGPDSSAFRYIASQGPMAHTIGDFYKCLINNNTSLIVCLTDVWEDGVAKCDPYWNSGTFESNNNVIQVDLKNSEKVNENMILRHIVVSSTINNETVTKDLLQVQLLSWLDNSNCKDIKDLLFITQLRSHLQSELRLSDHNTLVHCSAGCGRTGTFITIDTVLELMNKNYPFNDKDMVPQIVDTLRSQRISMVQNLRQYISIYDVLADALTTDTRYTFDYATINDFKANISK